MTGNILDTYCEAVVNPVNCLGIAGAGIALQMKLEAPSNFKIYRDACRDGLLTPGKLLVVPTDELPEPIKFIINFPTKVHWRDDSKMEWIIAGIKALVEEMKSYNLHAVAIPAIGSGCGGLSWGKVYHAILNTLRDLGECETRDRIYCIYEPLKRTKQ